MKLSSCPLNKLSPRFELASTEKECIKDWNLTVNRKARYKFCYALAALSVMITESSLISKAILVCIYSLCAQMSIFYATEIATPTQNSNYNC